MEVNRINNTSFKGISMPKKVVLMPIGMEYPVISTKQDFLNNPAIKECAEKYDILIKRGKKIGKRDCTNEERLKMTLAGGSILATGAITALSYIPQFPLWMAGIMDSVFGAIFGGILDWCIEDSVSTNQHEYLVQGGKRFANNKKNSLEGPLSREYHISEEKDLDNIAGLVRDIEIQDISRFMDIIYRQPDRDFSNLDNICAVLDLPEVKKEFYKGEVFNYPVDEEKNTLLLNFLDITPTEENKDKYNKVIDILSKMPNVDYNKKDKFGISAVEKILNSENHQAIKLIENIEIPYSKELDLVYEQITNHLFKRKAQALHVKFADPIKALELNSEEAFDKSLEQFNSPFCNKEALAAEILQKAKGNTLLTEKLRTKISKYL